MRHGHFLKLTVDIDFSHKKTCNIGIFKNPVCDIGNPHKGPPIDQGKDGVIPGHQDEAKTLPFPLLIQVQGEMFDLMTPS